MHVTVKLFASFQTGRFDIEVREYSQGTTVEQVVEGLGIPSYELGIILVNSRHVRLEHALGDGDTLSLFPLVGGG